MKRIYLIRHCKAHGQEPSAELTAEGRKQAELLADVLLDRPINCIVSSPYLRAISTIQPLAERLGLPIHQDDRLCERILAVHDLPDWMDHLKRSFDELDMKLPGGESSREAMNRGVAAIHNLIQRSEEDVAVVTHGNLLTLILKHYDHSFGFETWSRLTNPDVYELGFIGDKVIEVTRLWK